MSVLDTVQAMSVESEPEIPVAVLENLAQAMYGLKGPSGSQTLGSSEEGDSDSNSNGSDSDSDDYDDLDYTDFNWTGGRYDYQEQKDFITKVVLCFTGYKHDPKKTSKERYEERVRILNDRNTQHRRIFSLWPSSDKIMSSFVPPVTNPRGLAPPNAPAMWSGPGIWGATLFDFYNIYCIHPSALFQTSGSKMLEWCLKNDESSAAPQLAWAMTEPKPGLIEPCDIGELIQASENRMRMFGGIIPGVAVAPVLQQYLPQQLLPETLFVYDPDQLLYTSKEKATPTNHRYKLKFSAKYNERRAEDEAREVEAATEEKRIRDAFLADPHSRNKLPDGRLISVSPEGDEEKEAPTHQQFYYVHPLRPTRAPIKEAQLRISKELLLGTGNHSFVYDANFLLPRATFFEPQLCEGCIGEDMRAQLSKYSFPPSFLTDKVGRMVLKDKLLQVKPESSLTPAPAPTLCKVLSYEGPLIALQSTVEYSHVPCAKHQPQANRPRETAEVRVVAKLSKKNDAHLAREAENYQHFPKYLFDHWSGLIKVPGIRNPVPAGPVVPQFYGYYVPEEQEGDVPDNKDRKSNGDNTPGHSSDEKREAHGEGAGAAVPFLSPILLIENCGAPIQPKDYGFDDTQECCSLVYRLRDAGFFHASVASRNIVAQNGPLSAWPLERDNFPGGYANRHSDGGPSGECFRLIDFGRTKHRDELDAGTRNDLMLQDHAILLQWSDGREVLNQRW